jgi:hypothetical protein
MAEIKHGNVTVNIPDHLALPAEAGSLTAEEVRRIPKPRKGLGLACEHSAQAMEAAGDQFQPPPGITPQGLREAGQRADEIDTVIAELEVVLVRLKQANLLFDQEALRQLAQTNDQVNVQGKHNPELARIFSALKVYFERR